MESPIKFVFKTLETANQIDSTKTKQFRWMPISQTERLRLKNYDETSLHLPAMMSQIA